jgi:hypothetical protein
MACARAKRRGLAAVAVLVAALAGALSASAAPADDRCQHLAEGEPREQKLPTLIALAECSEQVGDLVAAEAQWSLARDRAKHDEKPQSKARAEARLAAVQKRLAHLTLQLADDAAGAQVLRDDVRLEPASLAAALPMNPGDHVILVKLAGHDDAKYAVKLADGDNQTLALAAGPATGARVAPAPPPPAALPAPSAPLASSAAGAATEAAAPPRTGWWSPPRTMAVILGSAGIVGVGAGGALCVVGGKNANKRHSNVDLYSSLGAVSAASGGVMLVTALVLLASAPSDEVAQHAGVSLTPTLMVGRAATVLGATGEF